MDSAVQQQISQQFRMQQYEKSITGSAGTSNCKRLYSVQKVLLIKREPFKALFLLLTEEILLLFDGFFLRMNRQFTAAQFLIAAAFAV